MCSWCFHPEERLRVKPSDSKNWTMSTADQFQAIGMRGLYFSVVLSKALVAELGRYRNKLQSCEAHLKASTELLQVRFSSSYKKQVPFEFCRLKNTFALFLQELTWSHAHVSSQLNISCSESVWPELLLQSNMEKVPRPSSAWTFFMNSFRTETFVSSQFDEVQEIFTPLEQQAHTFQTHLEGLGGGNQQVGPLVRADGACLSSASPQTSSLKSSTRTTPLSALKISTFKRRFKPGKKPWFFLTTQTFYSRRITQMFSGCAELKYLLFYDCFVNK